MIPLLVFSHRDTEAQGEGAKEGKHTDLLTSNDVREDVSCVNGEQIRVLKSITELWLFKGTAEQKTYRAEFVGVKTREELICDYGYLFWDGCALSWPKAAGTSPFGELQQSNCQPYCGNFGE